MFGYMFYFTIERYKQKLRNFFKKFLSVKKKDTFMSNDKLRPVCDIYVNKETKDFILENSAWTEEYGGLIIGCGPSVHISNNEMKTSGVEIVLRNLKGFFNRKKNEKTEYEMMTKNQQQKFLREHNLVSIYLDKNNFLEILPWKREGGGHIGIPEGKIVVNLPCTNEEFYQKLMESFEKC
jgi:hypothetical protein